MRQRADGTLPTNTLMERLANKWRQVAGGGERMSPDVRAELYQLAVEAINSTQDTFKREAQPWFDAYSSQGIGSDQLVGDLLRNPLAGLYIHSNGVAIPEGGFYTENRTRYQIKNGKPVEVGKVGD